MEPQIDFREVESLAPSTVLGYCNNFVINMVQFLNRFSFHCDRKLASITRRVQGLDITMNILDAKLSSIPALAEVTHGEPVTAAPAAPVVPGVSAVADFEPAELDDAPQAPYGGGGGGSDVVTFATDPRYATYFTMLRLRVPVSAIKQKMMVDGFDPNILDSPDEPSGYIPDADSAVPLPSADSSSMASFSDSEDF